MGPSKYKTKNTSSYKPPSGYRPLSSFPCFEFVLLCFKTLVPANEKCTLRCAIIARFYTVLFASVFRWAYKQRDYKRQFTASLFSPVRDVSPTRPTLPRPFLKIYSVGWYQFIYLGGGRHCESEVSCPRQLVVQTWPVLPSIKVL